MVSTTVLLRSLTCSSARIGLLPAAGTPNAVRERQSAGRPCARQRHASEQESERERVNERAESREPRSGGKSRRAAQSAWAEADALRTDDIATWTEGRAQRRADQSACLAHSAKDSGLRERRLCILSNGPVASL